MHWPFAVLLALAVAAPTAAPAAGDARPPGFTVLYSADERGEVSPCG